MAASNNSPTKPPPSPFPVTPTKGKEDKHWFKLGALGRKKRDKDVSPISTSRTNSSFDSGSGSFDAEFDISILERELDDGEERYLVDRRMLADEKLRSLINSLIDWLNDVLEDERIVVKNLEDDMYDGQILHKLLEKFTGKKLELPEVSLSEEDQRQKLGLILEETNQVFGLSFPSPSADEPKWSVDTVHSKSLIAILHLLVYLVRHFQAPVNLPENVIVEMLHVKKSRGKLEHRRVFEEITPGNEEWISKSQPDAIDNVVAQGPDRIEVVKKALLSFANKQLSKISLEVLDIETGFHDGVYLNLMMGMLEGYFVPLHAFHLTPKDKIDKLHNVSFALELLKEADVQVSKIRPEDIVNMNHKATLRLLLTMLLKYKDQDLNQSDVSKPE